MKIIKPLAITESMATSNAPETDETPWATIGRDFSVDFGQCLISSSDTKVYTLNSNSSVFLNNVKVQTVATGDTEFLTLTDVNMSATSLQVNKADTYIAMIGTKIGTSPIIQVYSLSTGLRVYENTKVKYTGNLGSGIQIGYKWSNDSATLAFWSDRTIQNTENNSEPVLTFVSTTGFGEVFSTATPSDYRSDLGGPDAGVIYAGTVDIVFDDTDTNVFAYATTYHAVNYTDERILMKSAVATGSSSGAIIAESLTILAYNPTRNEVIGVSGSGLAVYSDTTLAVQVDKPNLAGVVRNSYQRILHITDTNDLYVRDTSKSTGYVLFSMVDYSSSALLDPSEELIIDSETTTYYVTAELNDGFGLFDRATITEVTASNPSVITGNVYIYNGRIYEVLIDNTDRPDVGALLSTPSWLDLGVVNPRRMFDGKLDSLTTSSTALNVDITPNVITSGLAIFNINATTVQITMNDPTDGLVYDSGVIDLVDSGTITGWYEFFFGQRLQKFDVVKTDLPTYPSATITISIIGGDDITVGEIVIGKIQNIGDAQYGTSVGIIDFSRKEADQFGIFSIVKRRFSKRAEYDIKIPTGQNSGVQRTLADFRTTPLVWIGDENKLETVVYGYYRNFDILIAGPSLSDCTITVEGL